MYSLIGLGVGIGARRMQVSMQGEKDLMYFHYICLHPEDFPPPGMDTCYLLLVGYLGVFLSKLLMNIQFRQSFLF